MSADPVEFTLDSFRVGESNRFAYDAAWLIAERPAAAHNLLVICGPPGSGKSHLLAATVHAMVLSAPGLSVRCCSSQGFTEDYVAAIRSERAGAFRDELRGVDVLRIDDLQAFEGCEGFQAELRLTISHRQEHLRHTLIGCEDLNRYEPLSGWLRESGFVVNISLPDVDLAAALLSECSRRLGCDLDAKSAVDIAEMIHPVSAAELAAFVRTLVFYAACWHEPVSVALAEWVHGRCVDRDHLHSVGPSAVP